jgi:hypothetical protein
LLQWWRRNNTIELLATEVQPMRAYLITTGTLFAALAVLHVFVVVERWRTLSTDPWPAIILAVTAGLAVWAGRLVRVALRS